MNEYFKQRLKERLRALQQDELEVIEALDSLQELQCLEKAEDDIREMQELLQKKLREKQEGDEPARAFLESMLRRLRVLQALLQKGSRGMRLRLRGVVWELELEMQKGRGGN